MIPKLKNLTEPGPGSSIWETGDDLHYWWHKADGVWHCTCDEYAVGWSWEEIVDDIGPESTNYNVEAAK